jgi:hypothetical protein
MTRGIILGAVKKCHLPKRLEKAGIPRANFGAKLGTHPFSHAVNIVD